MGDRYFTFSYLCLTSSKLFTLDDIRTTSVTVAFIIIPDLGTLTSLPLCRITEPVELTDRKRTRERIIDTYGSEP